jgi:outer membrane protein assembly factor BamB
MMSRLGALALVGVLMAGTRARADDWPQWRGPHGTGVSTDQGFPATWTEKDIAWKAELQGLGASSPVVFGDHVFVTSQYGRGARRPGDHPTLARGEGVEGERPLGGQPVPDAPAAGVELLVEAFHRRDGRRLFTYRLPAEGTLPEMHDKHNLASPSPVTDGARVYAWFGNGQLVALDLGGTLVWKRHLGREIAPFEIEWGHGSSPALYQDLLYLLCDHTKAAYLLALDARTGAERFRVDRGRGLRSYSTPTIVKAPAGDELVVNSSPRLDAYDPATGRPLWHATEPIRSPIGVPTHADGVLYTSRGTRGGPYLALRLGGRGDVSASHVKWTVPTGAPYVASVLYYEGLVYLAHDSGIVTAVDPGTGERVWQERIPGIFSASPVAAEGRVYLTSETGEVITLRAGRTPVVLGRSPIGERAGATPALSRGQIFVRTDRRLVAVGTPRP